MYSFSSLSNRSESSSSTSNGSTGALNRDEEQTRLPHLAPHHTLTHPAPSARVNGNQKTGSMLHLFPRDNPDAAFVALRTRQFFKTNGLKPAYDESDSEDSSCYEDTDDEDEVEITLVIESDNVVCNNPIVNQVINPPIITSVQQNIKSALKKTCTALSPKQADGRSFDQHAHHSSDFLPTRTRIVKIVEPFEALAELRNLRKSFDCRTDSSALKPTPHHLPLITNTHSICGVLNELADIASRHCSPPVSSPVGRMVARSPTMICGSNLTPISSSSSTPIIPSPFSPRSPYIVQQTCVKEYT